MVSLLKSEYFSNNGSYVLLTPGNFIESGGFRWLGDKQKFYSGEVQESYILRRGDVLVAMTEQAPGLLGSTILIPESNKYLHNQRLGLIIIKDESLLMKDFVYHLFNSLHVRKPISETATGTKVKHTSPEKIGNIEVPLPPPNDQHCISVMLSACNQAIEKTERLIDVKEREFSWLLRELINNGDYKSDWRKVKLAEVASVRMGSSPPSAAYNEYEQGLPLIQGKADLNNRLSAPRLYASTITQECFEGDLLLSVRAPVGYISRSIHHCCIGRGIAAISTSNDLDSDYLFYYLLSIESTWVKVSQGGTFDAISSKEINQKSILLPDIVQQRRIAEILNTARHEINLLKKQADAYRRQKRGLMQKLLTGQWRVRTKNGG